MKIALRQLALLPMLSPAAFADDNNSLDRLMSEWLTLERQKGALQIEWNERRDHLERRLELLTSEEKSLREVIQQKSETRGEVDERRLSLLETQEKLEREQAELASRIEQATASAETLKPRLPPPLQVQWDGKLSLLSSEDASNSEKLERLLTLFKQVEEFNSRVAMHRSTMELAGPDGESRMQLVTQIYLGAGQGWYVSDDGRAYGYGRSTKLGWNWWHGDEASKELDRGLDPRALLQVRSVLENPTTAAFISLPVKVQ